MADFFREPKGIPGTTAKWRDFNSSVRAEAHGRVNLIGEHTDYNHGYVLPTSIPQSTIVKLRLRPDRLVSVQTDRGLGRIEYELGSEKQTHSWRDYIQGATWLLAREGLTLRAGFDLTIQSTVPMGSGLSSSAALLVSLLKVLRDGHDLKGLGDLEISKFAQRIENEFVGARVGIMDPLAASLANEHNALFVDTESLRYEQIPLPTTKLDFVVINSGIAHRHSSTGGYNERRAECEKACELLGVGSLREVKKVEDLDALPDLYRRRARHVVTENARVLEAVEALRRGDCEKLGELFQASHRSMSQDYDVSLPEIDAMVAIANRLPNVFGARLTGGGFGGSIVVAVKAGHAVRVADQIARRYREETRQSPQVLVPKA